MGCWDIFCFICGNPCHDAPSVTSLNCLKDKGVREQYRKFATSTKWMNKCTFLTRDNKIHHGCKEIHCNITFKNKTGFFQHTDEYDYVNSRIGIFIHTDCWVHIRKTYNISLTFGDVPIVSFNHQSYKVLPSIKYGLIEKYYNQEFDFLHLFLDGNETLCHSPLKSYQKKIHISKIFKQMKIRTDIKRKSPTVSASWYPNNSIKLGKDETFWIVKNRKWVRISNKSNMVEIISLHEMRDHKKIDKFLSSIPEMGYYWDV